MMRVLKGTMLLLMALFVLGCTSNEVYSPGTYTGEGVGHGGPIKVAVTVNAEAIEKIEVIEHSESDYSKPVFAKLIGTAMSNNTADVDAVAGATETSTGFLTALQAAVSQARTGKAVGTTTKTPAGKVQDLSCDVVIVGAGGAGLSAALEAQKAGADVIVLEKMPLVGGNTNYATGGLNAADTVSQKAKGIEDSAETFFDDTMKGGKNLNNPGLVQIMAEKSAATIDWLISLGGDFSDVGRLAGATHNRAHRPAGGAAVGGHLVQVLMAEVEKRNIPVLTESKVVAILKDGDKVSGVEVETPQGKFTVTAKAVILATGGFGANNDLVASFDSALKGFGTTNQPGATGDALGLVKPLDVALVDMKQIQTHPTVVPVKNTMITEAVRGNGAILVNRSGERFVSELGTRDVVSEATLAQEGQTAFLLFDQGVRDSLSAIESYVKSGLVTDGAAIEDVAANMNIHAASLKETVEKYNGFVASGVDADFSRSDLPRALTTGPFYMIEVGPAVHHTMGGLKIDTETRVIGNSGDPVPGLFAAGEVTGGVHGANRLGGNALSDITTFGRIAGSSAAAFVK